MRNTIAALVFMGGMTRCFPAHASLAETGGLVSRSGAVHGVSTALLADRVRFFASPEGLARISAKLAAPAAQNIRVSLTILARSMAQNPDQDASEADIAEFGLLVGRAAAITILQLQKVDKRPTIASLDRTINETLSLKDDWGPFLSSLPEPEQQEMDSALGQTVERREAMRAARAEGHLRAMAVALFGAAPIEGRSDETIRRDILERAAASKTTAERKALAGRMLSKMDDPATLMEILLGALEDAPSPEEREKREIRIADMAAQSKSPAFQRGVVGALISQIASWSGHAAQFDLLDYVVERSPFPEVRAVAVRGLLPIMTRSNYQQVLGVIKTAGAAFPDSAGELTSFEHQSAIVKSRSTILEMLLMHRNARNNMGCMQTDDCKELFDQTTLAIANLMPPPSREVPNPLLIQKEKLKQAKRLSSWTASTAAAMWLLGYFVGLDPSQPLPASAWAALVVEFLFMGTALYFFLLTDRFLPPRDPRE